MQTTIVTGFSGKGYKEYGQRFLDTFEKHNPGLPLHLYTEDVPPINKLNVMQFQQKGIPGLKDFLHAWKGNKAVHGKQDTGWWSPKEQKAKYSYRFDAYKFCKMVFTMWGAATHILKKSNNEDQFMIWLDGDTVVRQGFPKNVATQALNTLCDYAYLGREPKHTETGFLVFRLPDAMPILTAWVDYYRTGSFVDQKEWHSAFLFDRAREQFPTIKGYNLTPGGRGHVIHSCWVGTIFDHTKGNRKRKGRSPEAR